MVFETNWCTSSLIFCIGTFWLPLLYKSPQFSKKLKIILTIVVMIYTPYLIIASLEIGRKLSIKMEEFQDMLNQKNA